MKRALLALTLAAAVPFAASAAEGVSYNYVEAGYAKTDAKSSFADSDGWAINGSYAFAPNFHVFGGYSKQETDSRNLILGNNSFRIPSIDVDNWNVGVGYNHELSKRVDLLTRLSYQQSKADVNGFNANEKLKGGSVEAGVRGTLTPNWEGYALAGYQDYDKGYDGKFYGRVGAQWKFNPQWGVSGEVKFNGDETQWFVGPRLSW